MNYLQINNEKILPLVTELNVLLADYHIYYQNLRNFHWNVTGKNFFELHSKFEEMYDDTRSKIDEVAERIVTLKYHPISKLSEYLEMSKITEANSLLTDKEMVNSIINNHKILLNQFQIIMQKATNASDEGTIDLIGNYIRELEKSTWMLSAWSKDTKEVYDSSFVK